MRRDSRPKMATERRLPLRRQQSLTIASLCEITQLEHSRNKARAQRQEENKRRCRLSKKKKDQENITDELVHRLWWTENWILPGISNGNTDKRSEVSKVNVDGKDKWKRVVTGHQRWDNWCSWRAWKREPTTTTEDTFEDKKPQDFPETRGKIETDDWNDTQYFTKSLHRRFNTGTLPS